MGVITDETKIEEFLQRGVEAVLPSADWLKKKMFEGKPLTMYLGIDPTAPTLHIGNTIPLIKLGEWQQLGHKVVLLIGDFTAMIGDPTDKKSARVPQTREQVLGNAKLYKEQASIFLDFEGHNKAEFKYNSEWLSKLNLEEILNLTSLVTVSQMLKRDMFQERFKEGREVYLHEFLYPLMQGYDSVAMETDGEVGGNDQTFNMLVGRDLEKKILNKEKFVITMKLLADASGKKMGKSEGNMVALVDSPEEIYGKVMSFSDALIIPAFELLTRLPMSEIREIEREMGAGSNPRDFKMKLAKILVGIYHGDKEAQDAENKFIATFREQKIPDDAETVSVLIGTPLIDILTKQELVASKSDFRRLVDESAVSVNGEKIKDANYLVEGNTDVKIGKRRFLKILVS